MTEPAPALANLPYWPRWLNQQAAAAYVGVAPSKFHAECLAGLWPAAGRVHGLRRKLWDRDLLDVASNRISKISTGTDEEENGYGRDPGYFDRRIKEVYGDEEHPAPRLPATRG